MRRARRGVAAVGAIVWFALVPAPAQAHGSVADGTNYRSTVTDAGAYGLSWEVIGGDSLLSLTNRSGAEVVVVGYDDEAYLRFVPGKGVYENLRSPAVYWNRDRYASTTLPSVADATAQPEWARVATGDHFTWHDHRIHWMSPLLPTPVNADAAVRSKIWDWTIPIRVGGAPLLVEGQLWWEPAPAWWPTAVAWLLPLLVPLGVAIARTRPSGTVWRPMGTIAAIALWVVLGVTAVRLLDDAVAAPTGSGWATPLLTGGLVVVVAAALGVRTWRGHAGGFVAFGVAACLVLWRFWADSWVQLESSQLLSALPDSVRRLLVAPPAVLPVLVLVAGGPAAVNYLRFLRHHPGHLTAKARLLRGN